MVLAPVHQPMGAGRLVRVVAAFLAELPEGPDTDGQLAPDHGRTIAPTLGVVKAEPGGEGAHLTSD